MREENGLVVYDVSEFIQYLNDTLSAIVDPARVAVEGEVSSFNISQGKWVRFDLKDADGLMNCFLTTYQLRVDLEDGMKVRVYGTPKIYPKYGKLSITVSRIELVGEGAQRRAYELMKKRLFEEGLFAPERKRGIPRFPRRIGLIASRESAACGDFLRILGNRWSGVVVDLAHVQVQGEPAAPQIVAAFRAVNARAEPPDVIVLTRGGGSLEDLAAFNDERVARAIFGSRVPVVVGVGHERDETIADFVADLRASTPTNAAELVVPDRREIVYAIDSSVSRLSKTMDSRIAQTDSELDRSVSRLETHIRRAVHRIQAAIAGFRGAFREFAANAVSREKEVRVMTTRLESGSGRWLRKIDERIAVATRVLATLDPKAVLRRGYSIVTDRQGRVVREAAGVDIGAALNIQLHRGTLTAEVLGADKSQGTLPI